MCKNGVLKFFAKLTVKHLCQSLFFNNEDSKCCTYSANASFRSTVLTPVQPSDIAAVSFLLTLNVLCLLGIIHLVLETVTVRCSVKKDVLKNFAKFTVNICARVSFLIKLQGKTSNIVKKRLWFSCFPVNCTEFFYRISHPPNQSLFIW